MKTRPFVTVLLAVTVLGSPFAGAQSADGSFEVAAVRRNTSESTGGGGGPRPGGGYRLTNVTVRSLIALAWKVPSNRVVGGPGWLGIERYDVDARTKEKTANEDLLGMLRTLLRERFKAAVRIEQRELPVYHLVLARADGELGPSLERATIDCTDPEARKKAAANASRPDRIVCGFTDNAGSLEGGGLTMQTLAQILTSPSGRPVIDRTGLVGGYNMTLKWTPALSADSPASDTVSIFTAVQEQLGLRLQSATAPLDVAVVDAVERPTEN
jgi:uncharacterized protein (TIGR03435 family)